MTVIKPVRPPVVKHYGPGNHPGTGSPQSFHAGSRGPAIHALAANAHMEMDGGVPSYLYIDGEHSGVHAEGIIDHKDLPETLYHVATRGSQIDEDGILYANYVGGLGGASHDKLSVSLTIDPLVAQGLKRDLEMMAQLYDKHPDKPNIDDPKRRSWSEKVYRSFQQEARTQGWEFDFVESMDSNFGFRYDISDWGRQFFQARKRHHPDNAGKSWREGSRLWSDPLFFGLDKWGPTLDPGEIKVFTIPKSSLNPKVLVTDFDLDSPLGLQEVRYWGDIELPGKVAKHASPRHPGTGSQQDVHGKWADSVHGDDLREGFGDRVFAPHNDDIEIVVEKIRQMPMFEGWDIDYQYKNGVAEIVARQEGRRGWFTFRASDARVKWAMRDLGEGTSIGIADVLLSQARTLEEFYNDKEGRLLMETFDYYDVTFRDQEGMVGRHAAGRVQAVGLHNSRQGTIEVAWYSPTDGRWRDNESMMETLAHEYGHALDYAAGNGKYWSDSNGVSQKFSDMKKQLPLSGVNSVWDFVWNWWSSSAVYDTVHTRSEWDPMSKRLHKKWAYPGRVRDQREFIAEAVQYWALEPRVLSDTVQAFNRHEPEYKATLTDNDGRRHRVHESDTLPTRVIHDWIEDKLATSEFIPRMKRLHNSVTKADDEIGDEWIEGMSAREWFKHEAGKVVEDMTTAREEELKKHAQHNQKDHGNWARGSKYKIDPDKPHSDHNAKFDPYSDTPRTPKLQEAARVQAERVAELRDKGLPMMRGMKMDLPDELIAEIRPLLDPPMEEDQIGQHLKIGPMLIDHINTTYGGVGVHWTTSPGMAETAAVVDQRGGGDVEVIIFADPPDDDGLASSPDWTGVLSNTEKEITVTPQAQINVVSVWIKDGQRWREVFDPDGDVFPRMPNEGYDFTKRGVISRNFGNKRSRQNQLVGRLKRKRKYKPPRPKLGSRRRGQARRKVLKHASETHPGTGTGQDVHGNWADKGEQLKIPGTDLPRASIEELFFAEGRVDPRILRYMGIPEDEPLSDEDMDAVVQLIRENWVTWQGARDVRNAAAEIAGVAGTEEFESIDPHADERSPYPADTGAVAADFEARYIMEHLVENTWRQPRLYRAVGIHDQKTLSRFLAATEEGDEFDAPLLSFSTQHEVGDHNYLDGFGDDVLLVLDYGAAGYEYGDAVISSPRWLQSDEDLWLNTMRVEYSPPEDSPDFESGSDHISEAFDEWYEAPTGSRPPQVIVDFMNDMYAPEDRRWAGSEMAESDEFYYEWFEYPPEEAAKEVISGGRFRVTKVEENVEYRSGTYPHVIHIEQVGVFDPFNDGELIEKAMRFWLSAGSLMSPEVEADRRRVRSIAKHYGPGPHPLVLADAEWSGVDLGPGCLDEEVAKHFGPGDHPGTGTPQSEHAGSRIGPFNRVLHGVENTMSAMGEVDPKLPDRIVAHWDKITGTSEEEILARYRGLLSRAQGTSVWADGLDWYWRQHNDLTSLADEYEQWDMVTMAAAAAAMSPQAEWNANLQYTVEMAALMNAGVVADLSDEQLALVNTKLEKDGSDLIVSNGDSFKGMSSREAAMVMLEMGGWGSGAGYSPFADAVEIFRGAPPTILRGVKTRSFYNMLWDPGNTIDVTIDFQMMEAAAGRVMTKKENSSLNGTPSKSKVGEGKTSIGVRPYLADLTRQVAAEFEITPSQAQAVIWLQWKEEK